MRYLYFLITLSISISLPGQKILTDINPGTYGSYSGSWRTDVFDTEMYFNASNGDFNGFLWKTDGTTEGTEHFRNSAFAGNDEIAALANGALFSRFTKLFFTNGSRNNETELMTLNAEVDNLTRLNESSAIFTIQRSDTVSVYISDGTTAGTTLLKKFQITLSLESISRFNNFLVFAERSSQSNKFEPFMTDGTTAGTMLVNDYLASIGITEDVESALGIDDVLVTSNNDIDYAIFENMAYPISIIGDFRAGAKAGNKVYFQTNFNMYSFNLESKTASQLSFDASFWSNMVGTQTSLFYVNDDDDSVHELDPLTDQTTKISVEDMGTSNFNPFVKLIDNSIFYWTKGDFNILRAIDMDTKEDFVFDTISERSSFIIPEVVFLNNRILYAKDTPEFGYEWWVKDGTRVSVYSPEKHFVKVNAFPNPTSDVIRINFEEVVSGQLIITSANGDLVVEQNIVSAEKLTLPIVRLADGMYYGKITSPTSVARYFNFVKN